MSSAVVVSVEPGRSVYDSEEQQPHSTRRKSMTPRIVSPVRENSKLTPSGISEVLFAIRMKCETDIHRRSRSLSSSAQNCASALAGLSGIGRITQPTPSSALEVKTTLCSFCYGHS
jgi:hypothetical protein